MHERMTKRVRVRVHLAVLAAVLLGSSVASAGEPSILNQPDQHPDYFGELEVHGLVAYSAGPLALGRYDILGFGPGVHGNFRIVKNGFIPSLNDSVAIGIGAELVFDAIGALGVDVRLVTPVVLQWSFWVTAHWSVFGEPGFAIEFPMSTPQGGEPIYVTPVLSVGGRYSFNDKVAIVARVGYPFSTIGVSFFL
jgi:hypothetical protein